MKTNFEIIDNHAVNLHGVYIDLHNNFDFIQVNNVQNKVVIDFKRTSGDWVKTDEFERLKFEYNNVLFEFYHKGNPNAQKGDAESLEGITFFPSESREMNDRMIPQTHPKENDDLIMFFEDGKIIRIGCAEVQLTAKYRNMPED